MTPSILIVNGHGEVKGQAQSVAHANVKFPWLALTPPYSATDVPLNLLPELDSPLLGVYKAHRNSAWALV